RIPALIVQPLVENAIRHGLPPDSGATRIGIAAKVQDRRLKLSVRDPAGAVVTAAEASDVSCDTGFGLRYVRERLRHFYGDEATLTLAGSDTGTTVTLELPLAPRPSAASV
ncbi:MAG: ATP-binding protein, partial [Gemmatimonadota bacterium]